MLSDLWLAPNADLVGEVWNPPQPQNGFEGYEKNGILSEIRRERKRKKQG